jgi:hypothetical protein
VSEDRCRPAKHRWNTADDTRIFTGVFAGAGVSCWAAWLSTLPPTLWTQYAYRLINATMALA